MRSLLKHQHSQSGNAGRRTDREHRDLAARVALAGTFTGEITKDVQSRQNPLWDSVRPKNGRDYRK